MTYLTKETRETIRNKARKHGFLVFGYGNSSIIDVTRRDVFIFINEENGFITVIKNGKQVKVTRFEEITATKTLEKAIDDLFSEAKNL